MQFSMTLLISVKIFKKIKIIQKKQKKQKMSDDDVEIVQSDQEKYNRLYLDYRVLQQENQRLQEKLDRMIRDNDKINYHIQDTQRQLYDSQIKNKTLQIELSNKDQLIDKQEEFQKQVDLIKERIDSIQNSQHQKESLIQSVTLDTNRLSQLLRSQYKNDKTDQSIQVCCDFCEGRLIIQPSSLSLFMNQLKEQVQEIPSKDIFDQINKTIQQITDNISLYEQLLHQQQIDISKLKEDISVKNREIAELQQPKYELQQKNVLNDDLDHSQYDDELDFESLKQQIQQSEGEARQEWQSLNQLIAFLDHGEKLIRICVYTFTNREIVAKILEMVKAKPDLRVQIITDDVQTKIPSQREILDKLVLEGGGKIEVKLDNSEASLMHNKYLIMDQDWVATGSFNWTKKAWQCNRENLLLIHSTELQEKFTKNFEEQWALFHKLGDEAPPKPEKKPAEKKVPAEKKPKEKKQKEPKEPKPPKESKPAREDAPASGKGRGRGRPKLVKDTKETNKPDAVRQKIIKKLDEQKKKGKGKKGDESEEDESDDDLEQFLVDDEDDEDEEDVQMDVEQDS
ncbi:hypothetical protein pb186bvf_008949 [Paramecium bursaria]